MTKILSWHKQQPVDGTIYPISREGHTLTFVEGLGVIMFGGIGASLLNEMYLYDIESNHWQEFKTSGRQISPRCYHACFYHKPFFFIYAGQGEKGRSLGDLNVLNMNDEQYRWKKVRIDQPYARHQHTMAGFREDSPRFTEKRQYLFGGLNMPDNMLFNDFWILDFSNAEFDVNTEDQEGCLTKKIECTGTAPSKRKGHTALCYHDNMYIFGGQTQDIQENTTQSIYILNLDSYVWSAYNTELSHISPRSQMSSTWLNPEVVFFFGGLENISNKGLNDTMCLQMNDMHISFPFTAGEYPVGRYGHAACNYVSHDGEENMLMLGGIDHGFCTMDIYTLVEMNSNEEQRWEKIIQKDDFEDKATKEAAKYVYSARKHCLDLHDIVVEEKSKGIDIRRKDIEIQEELRQVEADIKLKVESKEVEINDINQENDELVEEMKNLLMICKYEQYMCQALDDKSEVLEKYFKQMQEYMNIGDRNFTNIKSTTKKIKSKKDKIMKAEVDQYKKSISNNRKKYQEVLLFLKHFYEQSVSMRVDSEKVGNEMIEELGHEIPELLSMLEDKDRYDEFMTKESKKISKIMTEESENLAGNKLGGYKIEPERIKRTQSNFF